MKNATNFLIDMALTVIIQPAKIKKNKNNICEVKTPKDPIHFRPIAFMTLDW
jgi:hypothetical protein